MIQVFDRGCLRLSTCHCVLCFVEGIVSGGLTGMVGRKDGWMKVDRTALRPTCCLSNALIRFRCEWTWHCDIKEFHSLHVSPSPYCINMPLMFHSDTGLFSCTSAIINGSDKYRDIHDSHFWFRLISHGCGDNSIFQNIIYPHFPESTDTKLKFTPPWKASKHVSCWSICIFFWEQPTKKKLEINVHFWAMSVLQIFMLYYSQLSAFLTMNNNKMTLVKK